MSHVPFLFGREFFLMFFPVLGMMVMAALIIICKTFAHRRAFQQRPTHGWNTGMGIAAGGFLMFLILFGYQKVQSMRDSDHAQEANQQAYQIKRSVQFQAGQQQRGLQDGRFQVFHANGQISGHPNQANGSAIFQTQTMPPAQPPMQ